MFGAVLNGYLFLWTFQPVFLQAVQIWGCLLSLHCVQFVRGLEDVRRDHGSDLRHIRIYVEVLRDLLPSFGIVQSQSNEKWLRL